jgi:hypothetical protein
MFWVLTANLPPIFPQLYIFCIRYPCVLSCAHLMHVASYWFAIVYYLTSKCISGVKGCLLLFHISLTLLVVYLFVLFLLFWMYIIHKFTFSSHQVLCSPNLSREYICGCSKRAFFPCQSWTTKMSLDMKLSYRQFFLFLLLLTAWYHICCNWPAIEEIYMQLSNSGSFWVPCLQKKKQRSRQKKLKAYDFSELSEFLPETASSQKQTEVKLNCKSKQALV